MTSFHRRHLPTATLLQLASELCWLVVAVLVALHVAGRFGALPERVYALALVFALLVVLFNAIFGLYRSNATLSVRDYVVRAVLAPAIGGALAYLIAEVLPGGAVFQDHVAIVGVFALGGLIVVRHAIVLPLVHAAVPHRVLVLGTGNDARLVESSLANQVGIKLMGFYRLADQEPIAVAPNRLVGAGRSLEDVVRQLDIDEIVVAVRQKRGGVLPLESMLDCRLSGVQVTDLASFFEREQGHIPVDLLNISWLIYAGGYRQGWLRTFVKRTVDITIAPLLLIGTLPVIVIAAALITLESGKPIIYRQSRVGRGGKAFTLYKFRSMVCDAESDKGAQWAYLDDPRVTRVGRMLRRTRIDELPQLLNVIRGEMSIVGPRPERPEFVAMLTAQTPLYSIRHRVKPGITGWAQVRYSYSGTVEQSMRKLEYDLYYVKNHSLALDLQILVETVRVVLFGEGAR